MDKQQTEVQILDTHQFRPGLNVGAVTIESERAIAEARGQMQLAKMFPRDEKAAYGELMNACASLDLANVAFYTIPQGDTKISGPSIRLAEEIARIYGNFEFGHRELSRQGAGPGARDYGKSEVEVYAWDKEKNNRSVRQITVEHTSESQKYGTQKLRYQRDVDNKIANIASKQLRGRILALIPKWMLEAAVNECRQTIANANKSTPIEEQAQNMLVGFERLGVTKKQIETYLKYPIDKILREDLIDMRGIYTAIRDGADISEYFEVEDEAAQKAKAIENIAKKSAQSAPEAPARKTAAKKVARKAAKAPDPDPEPEVQEETVTDKVQEPEPEPEQEREPEVQEEPEASAPDHIPEDYPEDDKDLF